MRLSAAVLLLWALSKVSYGRKLVCSSECQCYFEGGKIPAARCDRFVMRRDSRLPAIDINVQRLELSNCMELTSRSKGCANVGSFIPFGWFQRFTYLTHITIKDCPVYRLPKSAFANLTRLLSLRLERLPLSAIDGSTLQNTPSLRHLTLENMFCLKTVNEKLLANKKHFQSLRLSGTNLTEMTEVRLLLAEVRPSLRKFTWTRNQQQVTLPLKTFSNFKFKTLNLSYNKLIDVDFLYSVHTKRLILEGYNSQKDLSKFDFSSCFLLRRTRFLNLRSCNLNDLDPNYFTGFTKLHTLLLGKNSIRHVDGRIFKRMEHLRKLELSDNLLESIPISMKYLMQRANFQLDLVGNSLHCNCEISWLLNYPAIANNIFCANAMNRRDKMRLSKLRLIDLTCKAPDPPVVEIALYAPVKKSSRRKDYTAYFYTKVTKRITLRRDGQITLNEGESIILRCISQGDPPPIMTWEIISNQGKVYNSYPMRSETYNSIEWRIRQTDMKFDRYVIQCRAKSKIGDGALNLTVFNSAPTITVPPMPSPTPVEVNRQVVGRLNASEGVYDSRTSTACRVRFSWTRTGVGLLAVVFLWRCRG